MAGGYEHGGYEHGGHEGYGQREEEEDDRGRGGYQESESEDEPRATADASLFRWLAISYASTHLSMTRSHHGGCHGSDVTGGQGIVNRAKWKPVAGSECADFLLGVRNVPGSDCDFPFLVFCPFSSSLPTPITSLPPSRRSGRAEFVCAF